MSDAATMVATHEIVVDEVFPHAPEVLWKTLTTPELMGRWLKMPSSGFAPVAGTRFTYQTTPAGEWDGVIHAKVLEVIENERLVYEWKGGHEANEGYGSRLDTIVTWTLIRIEAGTRLRMVHSGFVLPKNDTAFAGMSHGWRTVMPRIEELSAEQNPPKPLH